MKPRAESALSVADEIELDVAPDDEADAAPSWLARFLLAMASATGGAAVVALVEGAHAAKTWSLPFAPIALGDLAVLVPLAVPAGLLVAFGSIALDPRMRWRGGALVEALAGLRGHARARATAAALVAPAAVVAWLVAVAHVARSAFAQGAPSASGGAAGVVAGAALLFAGAIVAGAVPLLEETSVATVDPIVAMICGATYAVALLAIGIRLGDASGDGPTPLAILGVLARSELDLSPVFGTFAIAAAALLGERVGGGRWVRGPLAVLAAAILVVDGGLLGHEAHALSDAPEVARAIEQTAPLGRVGLALARRATDRDHDGASALFGGGDCDDDDPRRSPSAIDVPGNGIDEDCSGADLPLPRVEEAKPEPPTPLAAFPRDLNLVLITVDTLRIDLGFMGYPKPVSPSLDALAARSTVFDRAYAMASYTGKSVGPTLIGKYPSECFRDGAHFDTYLPDNTFLAERLRAAGFRTMGAASHWYFQPKYGLTQGIDDWDMSAMPARDFDSSITSAALTDSAIRLLTGGATAGGRFFLWVHYFDPHANYMPHPEAPDFRAGAKGWAKPAYDGEVWFTDHHIGRLLDFIAAQPWGAHTAIAVTADHGEAFDEHGMNWHGVDLWEPVVRVPLILYVPDVAPHRVPVKRSLVDLVPTLLDVLHLPQPDAGELSGRSMAADVASPDPSSMEERDVFLDMPVGPQVPQHRAIIHGPTPGMKLMSEGASWFFLFDLAKDPGELNDLGRNRALFSEVRAAFDEKLATLHTIHVNVPPYQPP